MSAEYEDYEDLEDEDLFEEDDSEDPYDLEVQAVNAELEAFGRQSYSRTKDLTAEDWQALGAMVHEQGVSAEQAFQALNEPEEAEDFEDLATRIQTDVGRPLTEREVARLWEADQRAELRGEDDVDASEALYDLDDSSDRAEYIGERLAVPQERAEASGVLDDGEDSPSFNYDNPAEREAAIDAALSGESVSVHDSTDITEGDE